MGSVEQLREKAQQCRRLAQVSIDERAIEALAAIAKEFEAAAAALSRDKRTGR